METGSIVAIAPYYSYDKYDSLDKTGKYKYILNLIHGATVQLSEEYHWDKTVFEKAYNEVIESDFIFKIDYPKILSLLEVDTLNPGVRIIAFDDLGT